MIQILGILRTGNCIQWCIRSESNPSLCLVILSGVCYTDTVTGIKYVFFCISFAAILFNIQKKKKNLKDFRAFTI